MEKFIDMLIKKRENLIESHPSTENYRQLMGTELAFLGMSPLLNYLIQNDQSEIIYTQTIKTDPTGCIYIFVYTDTCMHMYVINNQRRGGVLGLLLL